MPRIRIVERTYKIGTIIPVCGMDCDEKYCTTTSERGGYAQMNTRNPNITLAIAHPDGEVRNRSNVR